MKGQRGAGTDRAFPLEALKAAAGRQSIREVMHGAVIFVKVKNWYCHHHGGSTRVSGCVM